uniref:Trichohyalin-like n=1 Tax=Caenorhabditis tropicalis TaxID=1561998 RepID=A0A1I7UER2_9PELO
MDIKEIRERLTVNVTSITSESVAEYEQDVDECCRILEHKLELEMEKKMRLSNEMGVIQSSVTELWDRVDKARRRESDISHRVTAWAQHLADLMKQVKQKRAQIGTTMDSSASLNAEIQQSLELLAEKREMVQRMRSEIDYRRHLHKQQLKDLKADCDREEENCSEWNAKAAELEKVVETLKEQRKLLGERLEEEKRMEQEQKKMLEELETMLKKAGVAARKKRQICTENANLIASFSTLTEEST